LAVRAEPLLKISRIRVFHAPSDTGQPTADDLWFDTDDPGAGFFPSRSIVIEKSPDDGFVLPNAIEVQFAGGPLNPGSVVPGVNFLVAHLGPTPGQPANQRKAVINATTVRWLASSLPATVPASGAASATTTYTVQLLGDGAQPITSQRGRRLDGELVSGFPSGRDGEGGNAVFTLKIKNLKEPRETQPNSHIQRAHGETP
jgi:hypothetical protein